MDQLDDAKSLAAFLKCSVAKIRKDTRDLNLPSISIGPRAIRYDRAAVMKRLHTLKQRRRARSD